MMRPTQASRQLFVVVYHHLPTYNALVTSPSSRHFSSVPKSWLSIRNLAMVNAEKDGLLSRKCQTLQKEQSTSTSTSSKSFSSSAKSMVIDRNITLWSTNGRSMSQYKGSEEARDKDVVEEQNRRKLLILFAYMLPQEKHLEKYRKMYFHHGFDVLTVKTSPFQFFFPVIGAKKVASNVIQWVSQTQSTGKYPELVVHAFSVGGYQFAEFIHELQKIGEKTKMDLIRSIQGTIFDSPCDVNSVPYGLSRTLVGDTIMGQILEKIFNVTRWIFYPLSTYYHVVGAKTFQYSPLPCPALFFASKTDKMAQISVIEDVVDSWKENGVQVGLKTWENTRHVGHYHAHPKEYETDVEDFLKKIKMA